MLILQQEIEKEKYNKEQIKNGKKEKDKGNCRNRCFSGFDFSGSLCERISERKTEYSEYKIYRSTGRKETIRREAESTERKAGRSRKCRKYNAGATGFR